MSSKINNPDTLNPIVLANRREIPPNAHESLFTLSDGWNLRNIAWPRKNADDPQFKGSLLFLPGRGDHYEKYLETLAELDNAGLNVTAFDWRGQGGSGRMLDDPSIGHIDDFAIWINDLAQVYADWHTHNPGPYFVMSHSMGGHLILRALAENVINPDAVILSAPMLGLMADPIPFFIRHNFVKILTKIGMAEKHAWKVSEKPFSPVSARAKILTHDRQRYEDEMFWWQHRPEVKLGPASWQWVAQAMQSTDALSRPGAIEHIQTKMLILATTADQLVDTKRIIDDAKRLPNCELILFGDEAAHELLRECDAVRDICMHHIYRFIDESQPA